MSRNTADGQRSRGLLFTGRPLSRPRRRGSVLTTALEWKRPNMCLARQLSLVEGWFWRGQD